MLSESTFTAAVVEKAEALGASVAGVADVGRAARWARAPTSKTDPAGSRKPRSEPVIEVHREASSSPATTFARVAAVRRT